MPGALVATRNANQVLDGTNHEPVRQAIERASSVREAAEQVGILNEMDHALQDEVRAVLDALPASIDRALLATVSSAVQRGLAITTAWEEGDAIAVRIQELADRVDIVLITPHGSQFVS